MENCDVIIVGGGPTGMMLACELALAKVKVVVIEKQKEISKESKAANAHPRTLECFAARGMADHFVSQAEEVLGANPRLPYYHFALMPKLRMDKLDSRHNYTLFIQQEFTVALLEEHAIKLGVEIRREHEVTSFIDKEDRIEAHIKSDNEDYIFNAQYIIGCDGASSMVRKTAEIDYIGTNADMSAAVIDAQITRPIPGGKLFKVTSMGIVLAMPMTPEITKFAIIHINSMKKHHKESIELEEVKACLKDICGDDYGIHSPIWMSRFGNANRLAAFYKKGRALLAGDAAHIHLPVGGQGLNYGIQDAFNLGWKLAAVINKQASEKLLDNYHIERHKVGEYLMENVRCQETLINNFSVYGLTMRKFFENALLEIEEVNKLITLMISGLYIEYPSGNANDHPLTGKRVADLKLSQNGKEIFLYDTLHNGKFTLVLLKDSNLSLPKQFSDHINIIEAKLKEDRPEYSNLETILVRPDAHVAFASESCNTEEIMQHLSHWLDLL